MEMLSSAIGGIMSSLKITNAAGNDEVPMDVDNDKAGKEKPKIKIKGTRLGSDILCQLVVDGNTVKKNISDKRLPILILDTSGSMGNYPQKCVNAWQSALRKLQYSETDQAILIEFETDTKTSRHTLEKLNHLNLRCRGGTTMGPVVGELQKLFGEFGGKKEIYIWVISDGDIGDQERFKTNMVSKLQPYLNSPNIRVCGVRLKSGSYGSPDTQAMCAVGLLSSMDFKLEDMTINDENSKLHDDLTVLMTDMRTAEDSLSLTTSNPCLVSRPGEEGKTCLDLWNEDFFLAKDFGEHAEISEGGEVIEIEMTKDEDTLKVLENYAGKVYFRLAQEKIAGLFDNTSFIVALEKLFEEVDKITSEIIEKVDGTLAMSTTSRGEELLKKVKKEDKSIRQKLRELRNMANIQQMSGNMQSDLLRQLNPSNRQDNQLFKRYMRRDGSSDPLGMMSEDIKIGKSVLDELKKAREKKDSARCFVSQETSLEGAIPAIEAGIELIDGEIEADSLLTLFGLHGIAIQHKQANYIDPMLLGLNQGQKDTISKVYPGVVLNQALLWNAKMSGVTLTAAGFEKSSTITAVVPIKDWNHPLVWRLYTHQTRVANIQTSANLRGTLTPLPLDRQALASSLLLKLMSEWGVESPTELQSKTMSSLLDTLQWKKTADKDDKLTKRREEIMGSNPETMFTTEKNLASELAPFNLVFCDPILLSFLGSGQDSARLWRALVSNTIYWRVRYALGTDTVREKVVTKLLSYTKEHQTLPLADMEPEPDIVQMYDQWDSNKAKGYMTKHKYLYDIKLFRNLYVVAKRFYESHNKTRPSLFVGDLPNTDDIGGLTVGMNFDLFCLAEVVKGIQTKSEGDRFDMENNTGVNLIDNDETATNFLKDNVKRLYQVVYDELLQKKMQRVKLEELRIFLEEFPAQSIQTFLKELNKNIPNTVHKDFPQLLKTLLNPDTQVVDLLLKMELLLLGYLGDQIWNNKSVLRVGCQEVLDLLEVHLDKNKMIEVKEYVKKHSLHIYREQPNRQGNGNEKPSFWAATNFVDPWSYKKRDKEGYKIWLEYLKLLEVGEPMEQYIFKQWGHLLTTEPTKSDVYAGKRDRKTGKVRRRNKRKENKRLKKLGLLTKGRNKNAMET